MAGGAGMSASASRARSMLLRSAAAGLAASIAKILFLVFLVLLVISFVIRAIRGQSVV